jgi:IS5 family transposase
MNTKLHAVADANGRPLSFFLTAGPVSDYTGAAALSDDLPKAQWLLGDRGYDADWFRDALQAKGIKPCILGSVPITGFTTPGRSDSTSCEGDWHASP